MPQNDIPIQTKNLILKQINLDRLSTLGRAAMGHCFTGFSDRTNYDDADVNEFLEELRGLTGHENVAFDPTPYRRFAGDGSLPRGTYFSVAVNRTGEDGGTLIRELRNYYKVLAAGIVQIFDSTEPNDRAFLSGFMDIVEPVLVLIFLPVRGQPNPFTRRFMARHDNAAMLVHLPLTISERKIDRVVDLRDPGAAQWFTRTVTTLQSDHGANRFPVFPLKAGLEHFDALLPSLLAQTSGGTGFTNIVGTWLRRLSVNGLVFPSARTDCYVDIQNGQVTAFEGWNFVSYEGSPNPLITFWVDGSDTWPNKVSVSHEGPGARKIPPLVFDNVQITTSNEDSRRGSWRVSHLRASQDAFWRFNKFYYLRDLLAAEMSEQAVSRIYKWFFEDLTMDQFGNACMLLEEALMGLETRCVELSQMINRIRQHGKTELADALHELATLCTVTKLESPPAVSVTGLSDLPSENEIQELDNVLDMVDARKRWAETLDPQLIDVLMQVKKWIEMAWRQDPDGRREIQSLVESLQNSGASLIADGVRRIVAREEVPAQVLDGPSATDTEQTERTFLNILLAELRR
jgi:hypothetical protein